MIALLVIIGLLLGGVFAVQVLSFQEHQQSREVMVHTISVLEEVVSCLEAILAKPDPPTPPIVVKVASLHGPGGPIH